VLAEQLAVRWGDASSASYFVQRPKSTWRMWWIDLSDISSISANAFWVGGFFTYASSATFRTASVVCAFGRFYCGSFLLRWGSPSILRCSSLMILTIADCLNLISEFCKVATICAEVKCNSRNWITLPSTWASVFAETACDIIITNYARYSSFEFLTCLFTFHLFIDATPTSPQYIKQLLDLAPGTCIRH